MLKGLLHFLQRNEVLSNRPRGFCEDHYSMIPLIEIIEYIWKYSLENANICLPQFPTVPFPT